MTEPLPAPGPKDERLRTLEQLSRVYLEFAQDMQVSREEARLAFERAANSIEDKPYRLSEAVEFQTLVQISEILGLWYRDPRWVDEDGLPSPLPLLGRRSFATLISPYLPQFAPDKIAEELVRTDILIRNADGTLSPRRIIAGGPAPHAWMLDRIPAVVRALFGTLGHNVQSVQTGESTWCERGTTIKIPASLLLAFDQKVRSTGQAFLNGIDEWVAIEMRDMPADTPLVQVSVQVFSYVDQPAKGTRA